MNFVEVPKKLQKVIRSKSLSTKKKYSELKKELESKDSYGDVFLRLNGECLIKEAKKRGVVNCTPYSVELEDRIRLVYEVYPKIKIDGVTYDRYIIVTDIANHEWRGKPYTKQFSE